MFSLLIPVYKAETFLHYSLTAAINAVSNFNQSNLQCDKSVEMICVDDGSPDNCGAILDDFAAGKIVELPANLTFRVIHQKNMGSGRARNAALEIATGAWIWFIDSDDAIHPDSLTQIARGISAHPDADAYILQHVYEKNEVTEFPPLNESCHWDKTSRRDSRVLFGFRKGMWGVVLRHDKIGDLRFMPLKMAQDVQFLFAFFWKTNTWIYDEQILYYYVIRKGSTVHSKATLEKTHDLLVASCEMKKMLLDNRSLWSIDEAIDYLKRERNLDWFTFKHNFTALENKEMRKLIPLWRTIQRLQFKLVPEPFFPRRLIVGILTVIPSPRLCRCLMPVTNLKQFIGAFLRYFHLLK